MIIAKDATFIRIYTTVHFRKKGRKKNSAQMNIIGGDLSYLIDLKCLYLEPDKPNYTVTMTGLFSFYKSFLERNDIGDLVE